MFLKSFLRIMLSQSNGQTVPQLWCCIGKMLRLQSVFCCFLGQHWGCKDKTGWRTADDAPEGSAILVPEGTGGLCHSWSCTQGFCGRYAFQQTSRSSYNGPSSPKISLTKDQTTEPVSTQPVPPATLQQPGNGTKFSVTTIWRGATHCPSGLESSIRTQWHAHIHGNAKLCIDLKHHHPSPSFDLFVSACACLYVQVCAHTRRIVSYLKHPVQLQISSSALKKSFLSTVYFTSCL